MSRRFASAHPCPTATKTRYPDRIAADLALARIVAEADPLRPKKPVRSYRCPCGAWHLTSRGKSKTDA